MVDSPDRAQKQELLRTLWLEAKSGALTAREQAKAWALREAWRDSGKTEHGMCTYIAGKLTKTDGAALRVSTSGPQAARHTSRLWGLVVLQSYV